MAYADFAELYRIARENASAVGTYTPPTPTVGTGGGGSGGGVGASQREQLAMSAPQALSGALAPAAVAMASGDTGRAQYGGPEGRRGDTPGGVYTRGRLGDMTKAQTQTAYGNLLGQPTGVVKPGAPDPRFGKSLEEMENALMGQQITSTGNWMNDLGLWGKSMVRNWPSRLIGKGAMAIGEKLGLGEQPPEILDEQIAEGRDVAPGFLGDYNPYAGVASGDEYRERREELKEAINLANLQQDRSPEGGRQTGRGDVGGVGGLGGKGPQRWRDGGLMSLAEGGRPGFKDGSDEEQRKAYEKWKKELIEALEGGSLEDDFIKDLDPSDKTSHAQGGRIGFDNGGVMSALMLMKNKNGASNVEDFILEESNNVPQYFSYRSEEDGDYLSQFYDRDRGLWEETRDDKRFNSWRPHHALTDADISKNIKEQMEGGRIGFGKGGDSYAIPVTPPGLGPEDYNNAQEYWGDAWDPNYADILISHWERLSGKSDPSMSSGGRVGFKIGSDPWDPPGSFDNARDYWGPAWSLDPMMQDFLIKTWENETGKSDPRDYKATGGRIKYENGGWGYQRPVDPVEPITGTGLDSLMDYTDQFLNTFMTIDEDTILDTRTGKLINSFQINPTLEGEASITITDEGLDPTLAIKKIITDQGASISGSAHPDANAYGVGFSKPVGQGNLGVNLSTDPYQNTAGINYTLPF